MIYLHSDFTKRGYKDYHVKKLMREGKLYFIQKGVYSTTPEINELELVVKKHQNAVLSLWTSCYCYGLVKDNHKPFFVATKQKDRKIKDDNIRQIFMTDELYLLGQNTFKFEGFVIRTFDLERLLIEIVRNKINIEYDAYQEMIQSFKKISSLLNKRKLLRYLPYFKDKKIQGRIAREIYNRDKIDE